MLVCRPRMRPASDRSLQLTGLYNIELVLSGKHADPAQEIVRNDINMDADGRIAVLTGPNQGRLAEEAARLAAMFGAASAESLLLLNESLASTSPGESLYLGARAVYATHLHELGARVDHVNQEVSGESKVVSLAAGVDSVTDASASARGTFLIKPGPPVGLSYALDIADRYEISFERLRSRIEDRRSSE